MPFLNHISRSKQEQIKALNFGFLFLGSLQMFLKTDFITHFQYGSQFIHLQSLNNKHSLLLSNYSICMLQQNRSFKTQHSKK